MAHYEEVMKIIEEKRQALMRARTTTLPTSRGEYAYGGPFGHVPDESWVMAQEPVRYSGSVGALMPQVAGDFDTGTGYRSYVDPYFAESYPSSPSIPDPSQMGITGKGAVHAGTELALDHPFRNPDRSIHGGNKSYLEWDREEFGGPALASGTMATRQPEYPTQGSSWPYKLHHERPVFPRSDPFEGYPPPPEVTQTILNTAKSEQQIENLIEIYGLSAVESVLTSALGRGNNYGRQ